MGACLGNAFALTERDRVMPVVPMFHANAWGLAYASLLSGAALILPDRHMLPATLVRLIEDERVTFAGGVPTIWAGVLAYVRAEGGDLSSLRLVVAGGSAVPHAMQVRFESELGVRLLQAWGMTETSPLGSVANPPPGLTREEEWRYRDSQGRVFCAVEARLAGDGGALLPADGEAVGEIEVRGPWITGSYHKDDDLAKFHDGWLRTGDVGTLDEHGFIQLTDRAKDVIKSGGEWISSMELENSLMAHPDVAEAAVIGVEDERWGERPLAAVVLRPGADVTADKLRAFMAEQIPRWQLPERWCFIAEIPKTTVGKFSKRAMREAYASGDYEIIEVRGPWITGSYYQDDDPAKFRDGWLRTGDAGTMDEHGFIRLTDRAKDVIKSGGEWISSMELENVLMAHPDVAEAAVIGVADERWGERPLAAVVLRSGAEVTAEKLRAFMTEQLPRWQLPERWCFVAEVPKTSVGKFSKRQMREAYQRGDYEIIEVR